MAEIRQPLRSLNQSRWYAVTIIAVVALWVSLSTTRQFDIIGVVEDLRMVRWDDGQVTPRGVVRLLVREQMLAVF